MLYCNRLRKASMERFMEETTLHGFLEISRNKKRLNKRIWAMIIVVCFGLCVWQSAVNIRDYLRFNVITAETYQMVDDLQYPAITIWNQNTIRRTVIGRNLFHATIMAKVVQISEYQVLKTCMMPEYDTEMDTLMINFYSSTENDRKFKMKAVNQFFDLFGVSKSMTFKKCWFEKQEIECDKKIISYPIFDGTFASAAFSINQDPRVTNAFLDDSGVWFNEKYSEKDTEIGKLASSNGNQNGYKFLLNVHNEEYCVTRRRPWYGVGMHMMLHDRNIMATDADLETSVLLQPGYEYSVQLKPKVYVRNSTENLGRCSTRQSIYLTDTNLYNRYLCRVQCIAEIVWKKCGCFVVPIANFHQRFARHHGLDPENVTFGCEQSAEDMNCYFSVVLSAQVEEKTSSFMVVAEKFCAEQCKQPCQEMMFEYEFTAKKLASGTFQNVSVNDLDVSKETTVDKTVLILNVFYENQWATVLEDSQLITLQDLFIYIGNNVGLFLGMSFMSFNEFWYYPLYYATQKISQNWKKIKETARRRIKSAKKAGKCWRKVQKRVKTGRVVPMEQTSALQADITTRRVFGIHALTTLEEWAN